MTELNTSPIANPSLGFIDGSIATGGIDLTGDLDVAVTGTIPSSPTGAIIPSTGSPSVTNCGYETGGG